MIYKFIWDEANDPYLIQFKKSYKLEKLVSKNSDELDTLKNCVKWVHTRWKHENNRPKRHDPISILVEAKSGRGFRCVEYSTVLRGCLSALGLKARTLSLRTRDVETKENGAGHVVVEAYLPKYKKWVMADPQFGTIISVGKIPLNAVELKKALKTKKAVKFYNLNKTSSKNYISFIPQYLFYFRFKFDQRIKNNEIDGLMLGPIGTTKPVMFEGQDISKSENDIFTHSEKQFYQKP
jgi:hypothetical protein